jgi:hypothetical protein
MAVSRMSKTFRQSLTVTFAVIVMVMFSVTPAVAQPPAATPQSDPWQSLRFLIGTWEAKITGGSAAAQSLGVYSFTPELKDKILARHSGGVSCKAPADFDCDHGDLLYLYLEGQAIKAIYFDNEGHVIHYGVSAPTAGSAVFLSDPAAPGPQFQLVYERKDQTLSGKFQMKMPGQTDYKSYLEWSGNKK